MKKASKPGKLAMPFRVQASAGVFMNLSAVEGGHMGDTSRIGQRRNTPRSGPSQSKKWLFKHLNSYAIQRSANSASARAS
jgi:hypothetical protein